MGRSVHGKVRIAFVAATLTGRCLLLVGKDDGQFPQVCNFHDLIHEISGLGNRMAMKLPSPSNSGGSNAAPPVLAPMLTCIGTPDTGDRVGSGP